MDRYKELNNKLFYFTMGALIILLLIVVPIFMYTRGSFAYSDYTGKGDINQDEVVDIKDAKILAKYIVDGESEISNDWLLLGDMNNDGKIKMNDVVILIKALINNEVNAKRKVIIVIGASQVVRMDNYKTSYSTANYNYSVSNGTLNYISLSGSGFEYQTGAGWDEALEIIKSYMSDDVQFYVFFPMPGNDIKNFTCNEISTDNTTMIGYIDNYNRVIENVKSEGYNVNAYIVSVHPVKVSQSTSQYVVTNEDANSCALNYRSNRKYYEFNKAIEAIIDNSYTENLQYEYLFEYIMTVNEFGNNYSYNVAYNTTDGIHWDEATTNYYVDLMFNNIQALQ